MFQDCSFNMYFRICSLTLWGYLCFAAQTSSNVLGMSTAWVICWQLFKWKLNGLNQSFLHVSAIDEWNWLVLSYAKLIFFLKSSWIIKKTNWICWHQLSVSTTSVHTKNDTVDSKNRTLNLQAHKSFVIYCKYIFFRCMPSGTLNSFYIRGIRVIVSIDDLTCKLSLAAEKKSKISHEKLPAKL